VGEAVNLVARLDAGRGVRSRPSGAVLDPSIDAPNQVPIGRSFPMLYEDEERDFCATVRDILGAWAVVIILGLLAYSVLQEGPSTVAGPDTTEHTASLGSEGP
jgi:hypothetical protein